MNLSRKLKSLIYLLLLVLFAPNLAAQVKESIDVDHWEAGDIRFDENKWTEVIVGNMPLVISVPHGGMTYPEEIPDREGKGIVTVLDSRTIETARAIQSAFIETFNKSPFIIISHISRKKVDQNREIEEATNGNELAKIAWHNFHSSIDTALAAAERFGTVTFIDLHGHGHPNQRLELGYLLTKNDLEKAFNDEGLEELSTAFSLKNILSTKSDANVKDLLFGEKAFGSLIRDNGIPATPSFQDPHPVDQEAFFAGGYNTSRYTGEDYPNVYGWQIECNFKGVRDSDSSRAKFGLAFVKAYMDYTAYIQSLN